MSELTAGTQEMVSAAKQVTIYALTDPDSGEVRYVGQTSNVQKRYAMHLLMGGASLIGQWVRDLGRVGKLPGLKVLEDHIHIENSRTRERWWISY